MDFQAALLEFYKQARPDHPVLDPHFDEFIKGLEQPATVFEGYEAQAHPLQENFSKFLQTPGLEKHEGLKAALREIEHQLRWFDASELDERFPGYSDHVTFTQIIGSDDRYTKCMYEHPRLNAGIYMQAPGFFYAPHYHDSVELYQVLSGSAYWKRGEEDWMPRKPGEFILHERNQVHAMRTANEPIIALWAWYGDQNAPVLFTDTDFHGQPQ